MRRLLLIATVATLAMAKPGLYREKEDFQYSRSSTDEGSRSGFYGAQRGNMGGNYERAHNMDGLAQHQMGGLVKQVEGELGDGSNTRSGSVFTAANSRGVYGSGHYDLSNLEGRNFQEGVSYGDSQSLSQQSQSSTSSQSAYNAQSSALNSAAYRRAQNSRLQNGYNGYNVYQYSGQNGADRNLQQAENLQTANQYGHGGYDSNGYYSQSSYNGQSSYGHNAYDQTGSNSHSASYGSNAQGRVVSGMPVKVVLRPGTRVTVPIATETYDTANSAAYNQNSVSSSNSINQNSDAELISNQNHQNSIRPAGAKHYESSYSYRKEWEKHDTKPLTVLPVAVPTANPFPKNSELYEDAQSLSTGQQYESTGAGSQSSRSHSSNSYSGVNVNSASLSQSRQHSAYNNLHQNSASSLDSAAASQGTYASGAGLDTTNQIEDVNSKPKSYHSSYSYHKSWERQGDPYVIKPATTGYSAQSSQRLTSAASNQGAWDSLCYGSNYQQSHKNVLNLEDCDQNGHIRVARSYNPDQFEEQNPYQQSQYNYDQEALSQQSQNLEDLGQQTQSQWDQLDVGQQSQSKWDRLEDLGQQSQSQWDKIEDLGQQTQNKFDKIEDLGQQTQNNFEKIEDLGQSTQNQFDKIEDFGQQTQNQFDKVQDSGQQTQTKWDNFEEVGQQTQSKWDNFGQQTQLDGQQLQNTWDQLESGSYAGVGQETQTNWDKLHNAQQDKSTESVFKNEETKPHGVTGTNEIPATEQVPRNENVQNENNPYWKQFDKDNNSAATNKHFNNPWFKPMSHDSQNNDELQNDNFFNQQSQTHNVWNNHGSSFSESHSQNNWYESNFSHHHTTDNIPQNTAPDSSTLWNLWNKVDTIEKQTISSKNNSTESETMLENKLNVTTTNGFNSGGPTVLPEESATPSSASTIKLEVSSTTSPTTVNYKQILQPSDVGRGDIGPEDDAPKLGTQTGEVFNDIGPKPTFGDLSPTFDHKLYKNPTEMETASQVVVNNKTASDVTNVFEDKENINSQQNLEQSKPKLSISHPELVIIEGSTFIVDRPMTQNSPNLVQQNEEKNKNTDLVQEINIVSQQNGTSKLNNNNLVQSSQTTDRQYNGNTATVEIEQSHVDQSYGQESENFDQQNLQQNNQNFNHGKIDSFNQPRNTHQLQNINTNIFMQDASTESISSINEQTRYPVETGSYTIPTLTGTHPIPRENTVSDKTISQEFDTGKSDIFGQRNNFYNQQFEQVGNFDQQNTGQELESFQQQSNNFDQQNTDQQFESFDQQNGKEETNMEQQFETFTQQLEALDSHGSDQSIVNLGTQNKDITNTFENIYKPPTISDGQQTEQFEHFHGNYGDPAVPVHKVENIESETVSSYNRHHTESLDQTEELGQQVQTAWGPYNNLNERTGVQEKQHLEVIPVDDPVFKSTITEDRAQKPQIKLDTVSTTQHTTPIDTPIETVTEKQGFWKSVGNKFVSAKDKVFSWFGSS